MSYPFGRKESRRFFDAPASFDSRESAEPARRFRRHEPSRHPYEPYLAERALEKQPFHTALIKAANEITSKAMKKYGVKPFDIPAERVRLLTEEDYVHVVGEQAAALSDAYYDHETANIFMRVTPLERRAEVCRELLHEFFHGKCFNVTRTPYFRHRVDNQVRDLIHPYEEAPYQCRGEGRHHQESERGRSAH